MGCLSQVAERFPFCHTLPKIELHAHLNGSIRDSTIRSGTLILLCVAGVLHRVRSLWCPFIFYLSPSRSCSVSILFISRELAAAHIASGELDSENVLKLTMKGKFPLKCSLHVPWMFRECSLNVPWMSFVVGSHVYAPSPSSGCLRPADKEQLLWEWRGVGTLPCVRDICWHLVDEKRGLMIRWVWLLFKKCFIL
jgi:hypothetical protein